MTKSRRGSAYEVRYDTKAASVLEKLPSVLSHRIFVKIDSTRSNPHQFFKRLEGKKEYRLRVGKYRIIADINLSEKVISILLIGHRKNVYH